MFVLPFWSVVAAACFSLLVEFCFGSRSCMGADTPAATASLGVPLDPVPQMKQTAAVFALRSSDTHACIATCRCTLEDEPSKCDGGGEPRQIKFTGNKTASCCAHDATRSHHMRFTSYHMRLDHTLNTAATSAVKKRQDQRHVDSQSNELLKVFQFSKAVNGGERLGWPK